MKILGINGSHRGDKGYTRFLLDKLIKGATAAGAECEIVTLANLRINRCLSCGKCNTRDHLRKCVWDGKDDVRGIFEKMAVANIIVYATPIYIFTVSSLLKTLLERMYSTADVFDLKITRSGLFFHHVDSRISSKPFVALICCDNMEKETPQNAISYFQVYSKFMDAPQVGLLVRNGGRFSGQGKEKEAEERAPKILEAYEAFEKAGRELALQGSLCRRTQKAASQNILPLPPVFKVLRHLRPFREKMLSRAREMTKYKEGDI